MEGLQAPGPSQEAAHNSSEEPGLEEPHPSGRVAAPLEDLMGTWVHSNVALVFKMDDRGFCQVEERCTGDGSLIASGMLGKQASRDGWRVWNSSRYGDSDNPEWPEAFRINESDHDLLEHMLLETWGDWDDAPPLRRCYDEITQQKCSPQTAAPATAVDASPVRLTVLSRDVALAGSGDGYVQLLECGSQSWSRRVGDWLAGATSKFDYGVNVVAFSPDGVYAFLGTTAGTSTDRMRVTDGYVICIRTDDGKEMWSWHARALNNSSALHVKDLSVAPDGQHVAVGFCGDAQWARLCCLPQCVRRRNTGRGCMAAS